MAEEKLWKLTCSIACNPKLEIFTLIYEGTHTYVVKIRAGQKQLRKKVAGVTYYRYEEDAVAAIRRVHRADLDRAARQVSRLMYLLAAEDQVVLDFACDVEAAVDVVEAFTRKEDKP